MGKDTMSEVHTNITINASGSQVIFHNPAVHPLHPNAGKPITAAVKSTGQPNGNVQGQVAGSTVVFSNPG